MSYDFSAIQNKTSKRISAKCDGKNAGYVILRPYKKFMWLQSLYVNPKHRGKGLSHKLLTEAIDAYPKSEIRLLVDPFRDKPLTETQLTDFYRGHGFKPINEEGEMARPAKEKNAGGDIIGGLAGLAARPFVGAAGSQAIRNKVVGGITNYVNKPIENALRRSGVHTAISKVYEHGTRPIPGTPKFVQPIMHDPAQRRAYGQWRADDIVHTVSNNPEVLGAYALPPVPGVTSAYLAGKHLLGRALGGGVQKLASFTGSFADELEKISNGDMLQYFQDHPEKLKEKQERDRRKKELKKEAQVSPYQQKTQWTCSAACLKAVLEHWGTTLPELVIIEAIGAKKGRGAECDEIGAAARKLGFSAFEYSFDSIDQSKILLDQDIPIICDIQSFNNPGKGHYVVMTSAGEQVELMDPNTPGNRRTISREEMDERWWDHAMAPPHQLMYKWGIIVIPPEDAGGTP